MSSDFGLVYPLWTDPHRPAELLDRAVGEVGLDHLTIPVVTGKIQQFRPNPPQPPHHFATDGGWHFPPQPAPYESGPLRPRLAHWFARRNVLGQVCEYAAKRNLPAILRIDLRSVISLPERESHLRTRNAWGDEVISAGACVLNADLRELLHATLADLLRYEPAGFQLVDWAPDLPVDRAGPRPLDWHPLARKLLDVCFCPACRQTATVAGINPDQAARSVRVHIQRLLTNPEDNETPARVRQDELLDAYLHARRRDTASWLKHLADAHRSRRRYLLSDPAAASAVEPLLGEDAFGLLLHAATPLHAADEDSLQAATGSSARICGLALPVWRPSVEQPGQLVREVSALVKSGISFFDFEGLEEAPPEAITWLKQAVRFARRG